MSPGVIQQTHPHDAPTGIPDGARRNIHRSGQTAWIAGLVALVWAAGICYCLFRMPLPVSDCLDEIVEVQRDSGPLQSFRRALTSGHYFRPLRVMQSRIIFDLADGRYWLAYRVFHALLVVALFVLLVSVADIRDRAGLLVLPFALTVFAGHHGFLGNVKEIYPVNHFLEVVVLCLAAFEVSRRARPPWGDICALAIFVVAVLVLESGVLVWCVIVAARFTGLKGVSRGGIVALSFALAAYVVLRFVYVEFPREIMNATGVGSRGRTVAELREMFRWPWVLYGYNMVCTVLSVLFSEPRGGVWLFLSRIGDGIPPRLYVNLASSILTTGVVVWFIARRAAYWRRREFGVPDRLVLTFLAILAGTAAVSFSYTKNEILGVAAAFYALAVFAAVRELLVWASARRFAARAGLSAMLVAMSLLWGVRSAGLFHNLRSQAFTHRNDWGSLQRLLDEARPQRTTPEARALIVRTRREALATPATNPYFVPRWADRVFDVDW